MIKINEYLTFLLDSLTKDPDIGEQPLYSPEGILFGFEDHEDTARRFGVSEFEVRVMVNQGLIAGVKSNDHLIIPKTEEKPKDYVLPNFLPEEDADGRYSGLVSDK